MINEDKIRQVYASDPKKGFKMLMDNFQVPIYNYIRRLVVSHEDAEDVLRKSLSGCTVIWTSFVVKAR